MSLTALLPQPRHYVDPSAEGADDAQAQPAGPQRAAFQPPAYGSRGGFVPRKEADFADGGAFPEIHTMQYPRGMGRKETKGATGGSSTAVVPISVDAKGEVQYDAIVKQGHAAHVIVHSGYQAMQAKNEAKMDLAKPSEAEEERLAEETKRALGMIVEKKIATAMPTHVAKHSKEAVFIKYTPSEQNASFNSGAAQRIIRLQEMPIDPLQPPKFKVSKLPPGAPDAPVPVMHSPPRKITVEDQAAWQIPPCVSGWKNIKGYVIPLHQRLAADGRGLQEVQVNDKFASLSESLFMAERASRVEIEQRAALAKKMQRKAKEQQEEELRNIANQARHAAHMETDTNDTEGAGEGAREGESYEHAAAGGGGTAMDTAGGRTRKPGEYQSDSDSDAGGDAEGKEARDALRRDRQRDLKREMRQESRKVEQGIHSQQRERERDVSEKIALGQAPQASKDTQFDQRLFNQDGGGLSSGFGSAEDYDVYSKPLFSGSSAAQTYRPKAVEGFGDDETSGGGHLTKEAAAAAATSNRSSTAKFQADRGFAGTEGASTGGGGGGGPRAKPVEFERAKDAGVSAMDDPFGLGNLLNETRRPNALDAIGKAGPQMGLGREQEPGQKRQMQFQEAAGSSASNRRQEEERKDRRRRSRSRSRSRSRDRRR